MTTVDPRSAHTAELGRVGEDVSTVVARRRTRVRPSTDVIRATRANIGAARATSAPDHGHADAQLRSSAVDKDGDGRSCAFGPPRTGNEPRQSGRSRCGEPGD